MEGRSRPYTSASSLSLQALPPFGAASLRASTGQPSSVPEQTAHSEPLPRQISLLKSLSLRPKGSEEALPLQGAPTPLKCSSHSLSSHLRSQAPTAPSGNRASACAFMFSWKPPPSSCIPEAFLLKLQETPESSRAVASESSAPSLSSTSWELGWPRTSPLPFNFLRQNRITSGVGLRCEGQKRQCKLHCP